MNDLIFYITIAVQAFGGLMLLGGLKNLLFPFRPDDYMKIEGIITGIRESRSSNNTPMYYPIVEYMIADNRFTTDKTSGSNTKPTVGQKHFIYVHKDDPNKCTPNIELQQAMPVVLVVMGAIFVGIGFAARGLIL